MNPRPKLKLKSQVAETGEAKCPSCGQPIADTSTLCTECGWNRREGRRVGDQPKPTTRLRPEPRKRRIRLSPAMIYTIIAVAAAAYWWFFVREPPRPRSGAATRVEKWFRP